MKQAVFFGIRKFDLFYRQNPVQESYTTTFSGFGCLKRIAAILFLSSIFYCTNAQDNMIGWQSGKPLIDGNTTDWNMIPRYYDANLGLAYDMRNDSTCLYLVFRISNLNQQMDILKSGFSIGFKIKGMEEINAQIAFPVLAEASILEREKKPDMVSVFDNYILENSPAHLNGFIYSNGQLKKEGTDEGKFLFSINRNASSELVYELQIPLSELFGKNFVFAKIIKNTICLRAESEAFAMKSRPFEKAGGHGSPGEGMTGGGMPGGGMGGPPGGGAMPGNGMGKMEQSATNSSTKTFLKHKFKLAKSV